MSNPVHCAASSAGNTIIMSMLIQRSLPSQSRFFVSVNCTYLRPINPQLVHSESESSMVKAGKPTSFLSTLSRCAGGWPNNSMSKAPIFTSMESRLLFAPPHTRIVERIIGRIRFSSGSLKLAVASTTTFCIMLVVFDESVADSLVSNPSILVISG